MQNAAWRSAGHGVAFGTKLTSEVAIYVGRSGLNGKARLRRPAPRPYYGDLSGSEAEGSSIWISGGTRRKSHATPIPRAVSIRGFHANDHGFSP